jgi:hypothetical protein
VLSPVVQPAAQPAAPKERKVRRLAVVIAAFVAGVIIGAAAGWLVGHSSGDQSSQKTRQAQKSQNSSAAATYDANQAYARDTKRHADILSVQTNLEAFFEQQGHYPSLSDMNDPGWRSTNMKNLDAASALVDPSSDCDPATEDCLVASPKKGAYSYAVSDSSGKSCESDDTRCAKYKLTVTYEGDDNGAHAFSVENLD